MPLNVKLFALPALDSIDVSFGKVLSKRGTDWKLYKNAYDKADGDVFEPSDSLLFRFIAEALMQDDAGVLRLEVTPYTVRIVYSAATPQQDIEARVLGAIRRTGTTPVRV